MTFPDCGCICRGVYGGKAEYVGEWAGNRSLLMVGYRPLFGDSSAGKGSPSVDDSIGVIC